MKNLLTQTISASLILLIVLNLNFVAQAQNKTQNNAFSKIEMLVPNGERTRETAVSVRLLDDAVQIEAEKSGAVLKTFKYSDIKEAEYSYTKNPRWKTGLGLGAASIIVPPLLLIAIPLGFTKHRRHWLSIRTGNDYAVLKLSKSNRKIFIPAFESSSGIDVEAVGEDK